MKRFLRAIVFATTLILTSCQFDDSDIWGTLNEHTESIKDHEQRISALEELCELMNTNINALQTIVTALQNNDYVTSVIPVQKDGAVIGYTITFTKSQPITIYHGTDGTDGKDGKDGYVPQIGVAQHIDGIYYWTIDGKWLLDDNGNRIKAVGTDAQNGADGEDGQDGADGKDGQDGVDGTTPLLKIENDYWYVSYDNGVTWTELGKAKGEDGQDGANGQNGSNGQDGDSMFKSVTQDEDNVYFTLSDGTVITLPKCNKADIEKLLERIQSVSYIPTYSDGKATVKFYDVASQVALDFEISPKDAVVELAKVWQEAVTLKAVYTQTRAVSFIDMPIIKFEADSANGVISVTASGENLSAEFFNGAQTASVRLAISDGNNSVTSDYVPMIAKEVELNQLFVPANQIWYTSYNGEVVKPFNNHVFGKSKIVSNTYNNGLGIIIFDTPVTSIGSQAFLRCGLTRVTIPDGVTEIGSYAFSNCSLTSVTIPDSVTEIERYAFSECKSLASITFGDSITLIGGFAFSDCNRLTNVTIPDSVTSIGNCAFVRCNMLTSVTIPNSITEFGYSVFADCSHLTSVTIIDGITLIGEAAFSGCTSLTSITIPDSVTSIGKRTFSYCGLTSVTIPDSVTEIGNGTFSNCSSLQAFHGKFASEDNRCLIVDGVLNSFAPAGLTEYTISNSVTSIGAYAFRGCVSLINITIPNRVTKIGEWAFDGCKLLTSVAIPDSVTSIGESAFSECGLTSVTIPDSVTSIGNSAFSDCNSLTSIAIPDSITEIGAFAFSGCTSLTSITIPDSVTSIGVAAFQSCKSLTSITIPDSITEIGAYAFSGCTSLTSVYCKPTTPPIAAIESYYWDTFNKNASGRKIYVPRNSVSAYKSAPYWSDYADDIEGYDF